MVGILNSAICTKKLDSFILTQLDDDSHLEFCHLEFHHLMIQSFSTTHSDVANLVPTIWLKKNLLNHSHSAWWWQPSLIQPFWILLSWIKPSSVFSSHSDSHLPWWAPIILNSKPSWIQTFWLILMMADTLNIFSSLDSKTLCTQFWLWLKLVQSESNSFIVTLTLMMAAILQSAILNLAILDSAILVFSSETHSHMPRLAPMICTKTTSLIHSDSTWWWQPSWISAMLDSVTAILDSDTLLYFSQIHSKTPSLHSDSDWN